MKEHLQVLCDILASKKQYKEYLKEIVEFEANRRLKGLVRYFRSITLKYGFVTFVYSVLDACLGRRNSELLLANLQGDSERDLVVRKLRFYSK